MQNSQHSQPPTLPKLKELKASTEDILGWIRLPETRLFFKGIAKRYANLQYEAAFVYNREDMEQTFARLAEIRGMMRAYGELLQSVQGPDEDKITLFSQEDLEEAISDRE